MSQSRSKQPKQPQALRIASKNDIDGILRTLKVFHKEMGFPFEADVARVATVLESVIGRHDWVCFIYGDPISGVLLASAEESAFAPLKYASEKLFWVHPIERHNGVGRRLIGALEEWGLSKGCHKVSVTAQVNVELKLMTSWLNGLGYQETEIVFSRDLY